MGTRCTLNLSADFVRFPILAMAAGFTLTICQTVLPSPSQQSEGVLQTLRSLAEKNESSAALIKMEYTVQFSRSDDDDGKPEVRDLSATGHLRTGGVRFSHYAGLWAQDGIKQHSSVDYYSQDKWHRGSITVMDGEVKTWGKKPDLMRGSIDHMENFDWMEVGPNMLGMRVFEAKRLLSELLVPQYASVHAEDEMIDSRKACVVDIRNPSEPPYYARMWIDSERGLPIRIEFYGQHPTIQPQYLGAYIESIKHRQLPNGGWIPVGGTRSVVNPSSSPRVRSEHVVVDVNSITIERDEIPDSLFTLTFPEGASVSNRIVGMSVGDVDMVADIGVQSLEAPDGSGAAAGPVNQPAQLLAAEKSPQAANQARFEGREGLAQEDGNYPAVMSQTGHTYSGIIGILLFTLLGASAFTLAVWLVRSGRKAAGRGDAQ